MDRTAEEAAIEAAIAAGKCTVLPMADPVERAIEVWRAEKAGVITEPGTGMRRRGRPKSPKSPVKRSRKKYSEEQSGTAREAPSTCMWNGADHTVGTQSAAPHLIAALAYTLWERDGCTHGRDVEHWLTAEAILKR